MAEHPHRRRARLRWAPLLVIATVVVALLAPASALATPRFDTAPQAPADPVAVDNQVQAGLVQITTMVEYQGVVGNGAGIVLNPNGEVLTNHHVVQGANSIRAISIGTGESFDADVIGYDRGNDIALLQLRGASGLPAASIGDSGTVRVGDPVTTFGNANGTGNPLTDEKGTVTALNRSIDAQDELTGSSHELGELIESSTNLRAGDSGGALVNSSGQVVGLNAAATVNFKLGTPGGQGFAIPINKALDIAGQIRAGAASATVHIGPSALLGIGVNSSSNTGGLPVRSLLRGGPAAQAGVQPGDVLTTIDGVPIDSANALTSVLDRHYPGDTIDVTWRDHAGQDRASKVTLGSGPVS